MKNSQEPPLVLSGLVLGMTALGNLLGNFSQILRLLFIIPAFCLYLLLIYGIVKQPKNAQMELQSPLVASVFPTFFMVGMLFSVVIIQEFSSMLGHLFWIFFVVGNFSLICYYVQAFVIPFKWENVFPSWSVLFVGIAMAALTAPASGYFLLGKIIFWFCLGLTFLVLPIMAKKTYQIGLPQAVFPNISTFCAPLSLLSAAYLASFEHPQTGMVIFLLLSSQLVYFFVMWQLPKLLNRPFNPGFAAFTFPYVISATSLKMALGFLGIKGLVWLLFYAELGVAVLLVTYVFLLYIKFLASKKAAS